MSELSIPTDNTEQLSTTQPVETSVEREPPSPPTGEESYQTFKETREAQEEHKRTDDEESEDLPKRKGGFQRRVDKLTREKYELKQELARYKGQAIPEQAAEPVERWREHDPAFGGEPEFVPAAELDRRAEELAHRKVEEYQQAERENKLNAKLKKTFDSYQEKMAETVKSIPQEELDQLCEVQSRISINENVQSAIYTAVFECPNGPDVSIHILRHPEILQQLDQMEPTSAFAYITRLSAQLEAPREKPVTRAPEPIRPISGGSARSAVALEDMSYQDYKKARAKGRTR